MDNMASITDKNEKLKEILLLRHKKYVETFTYHCINVQDMYKEAIGELAATTKGTINSEWEYDTKGALLETFVELQNALKKYVLEMKKVFSCHYFMSEISLQKLESRACKRSVSSENDDPLLSWTINQYGNKYAEINKEVILAERDILENTAIPIVLKWYQDEAGNNPIVLIEKHELLKTTCKEGIKTCLSYSDNHVDLLKSAFEALDLELDQLYEKFKEKGKTPRSMASNNVGLEHSTLKRAQTTKSEVSEHIPAVLNKATPTLAVEFNPYGIKCGIMGDGRKLLIMTYDNNEKYFPFSFDFDKKDQIIFHGKLQESFNTSWNFMDSTKLLTENQNIQIKARNGDIINIGQEFICALTLEKVKRRAELILGLEIEQTTVAIPLRYTTTKRRLIKDAAEIAGFKKVKLLTETTAAAIAYFTNPKKTSEDLQKILLVLIHSKHHYDAAIYKLQNGLVKMVTCTGDCHNHKNKNGERLEKHLVRKFKKTPVGAMIYRGNDQTVAASISHQLSCSLEFVKDIVLLGAAKYSELDSNNRIFLDLYPYKLELKDGDTKTTILKLPRRSHCNETENLQVLLKPSGNATVRNKTIISVEKGNSKFITGEFPLKGDRLLCTLDDEGIMSISSENNFIFNSFSLQPKEKESCLSFLLQKAKREELRRLAEFLLKTSMNIPKEFVREAVRSDAAGALEFLESGDSAGDSSMESIQTKISFLKDLKDKYAS